MDINLPVAQGWLTGLLDFAHSKQYALVIGVDTNSHSTLFGPTNNTRGNDLEDVILTHGLAVENRGTTPTFEIMRGNKMVRTHIDATLSRDLPVPVTDWRVDRNYNASDHNTITFTIPGEVTHKQKIAPGVKRIGTSLVKP